MAQLFDGATIMRLKAYFSDLRKSEPTLMRCGRAVTERLGVLGLAMAEHMRAAEHLVVHAQLARGDGDWSYDLGDDGAAGGDWVLLACHDPYRLRAGHECGIRVFKCYWSNGRWHGDHLTSHWQPYAWRPMAAAPALPAEVMESWHRHGYGRADGLTDAALADAGAPREQA